MTKFINKEFNFKYRYVFLVSFFAMFVGCICNEIFPFGKQSFLRSDLYNQYIQFIYGFKEMLFSGEGFAYSFEAGLGQGFAALYYYYVASPLNWILYLIPNSLMIEGLTILIFIKVGLSSLSMSYYLADRFSKKDMGVFLCGITYALSGFMTAYQWNVMWLDVIILAPLVLRALEKLVKDKKPLMYCALLALSIFTNFYLSIMLCIFLVLYFLILIAWIPFKDKVGACFRFGFYSALAGGISAVSLLPVYVSLTSTEFSEFKFPEQFKWYMNGLELISRHCINVNMKVQYDHWPNIYVGALFFIFIPLFILNKGIKLKDKITHLALIGFMLLSFMCNYLEVIWHGMNYPDSLPGRQGYLYVWLVLVLFYKVYMNISEVKKLHIIIASVISALILLAGFLLVDIQGVEKKSFILTAIFLVSYVSVMLPLIEELPGEEYKYIALLKKVFVIIVIIELFTNLLLTSIRTSNRENFVNHYKNLKPAVEEMKNKDDGLYRTELFDRLTKNDSFILDINTATIFSSTANAKVSNMFEEIGMGETKVSNWYAGATPLTSAMLSVKYMLGENLDYENSLYEVKYQDDKSVLYKNTYHLPFGYTIPKELEEVWQYERGNQVSVQNDLVRELGVEGKYLVKIKSEKVDDRNQKVIVEESGHIFVFLGNNSIGEVKVKIGENKKHFKQVSFDYILDLGYIEEGTEVLLEVYKDDKDEFKFFEAYRLNEKVLSEAINILGRDTLKITKHSNTEIVGNIRLDEPKDLIIPIPVEEGWKVYVNNKLIEPELFMDTFFKIPLEAGDYGIGLVYETPGFNIGLGISIMSLIILGLIYWKEKKKNISIKKMLEDIEY